MTFLLLLLLPACSEPEAAEPPLPPGAEAFRAALRQFHTVRMWILAPERNGITDHRFWFGQQFVLSLREDGSATVDKQGQGSRYGWFASGPTVDGSAVGQSRPPDAFPPSQIEFVGIPGSERIVQEAIAVLRSPDTPWFARGPGHYGWGHRTDEYAEVALPALEAQGCHLFLRFGTYDALHQIIVHCGRGKMLPLTVLRLEVDPPLPDNWFAPDAPEIDTRTKGEFQAGEPTVPQDPGFYAPGATPPPAWRGDGGGQ